MFHREILAVALVVGLIALASYLTLHPVAMFALGVLPVAAIVALRRPFVLCVLFIVFSFFRLHEAFPILEPFKLPQLLAIGTLGALFILVATGRRKLAWSRELALFLVLFAVTTVGIPFSDGREVAMDYWKDSWIKVGVMVFAIATLARDPADFRLATRVFAGVGAVLGFLAVGNWFIGIEGVTVVEGSRAVIARATRSVLGDPNDLSLVLLFPLSFAAALAFAPRTALHWRLYGIVCGIAVVAGVAATQSRGGILGVIAVFGAVAALRVRSRAVVPAVAALGILVLLALVGLRGGGEDGGADASSMGRIAAWKAAFWMAVDHPFVGVGLNNFRHLFWAYTDRWEGLAKAVHSTWFAALAESGFLGFAFFMAIVIRTFRASLRSASCLAIDRAGDSFDPDTYRMALALVSGFAGFAVSGTFLTQAFTWPLWIILALTVAIGRHAEPILDAEEAARTVRFAAVVPPWKRGGAKAA